MKLGSALLRAAADEERTSYLGHELSRCADAVAGRVYQLSRQPLTVAQHFGIEPVEIGIDFPRLDRLLAEADAILAKAPDVTFVMHAAAHSFAMAARELRDALGAAEPYRRLAAP